LLQVVAMDRDNTLTCNLSFYYAVGLATNSNVSTRAKGNYSFLKGTSNNMGWRRSIIASYQPDAGSPNFPLIF